ncbi:MAG: hypothetical protein OEP95_02985 [Myxococcales bacterium]|nr:hypothetical protein [Myxococcales bacterium]
MKWISGLLFLAIAVAVALPGAVHLGLADLPEPLDADLAQPAAGAIPEPNAFDALTRAAGALPSESELDASVRAQLTAAPFDPEASEALLAAHPGVLEHFEAALSAPAFRMPEIEWDEDLPSVQGWFTAARLHALGLRLEFERRDDRDVGPAVRPLLELGQAVQLDPSATWLHWIAGAELKEIGLRTLIAATETWRPTAGVSHGWARTLSEFATRPDDLRNAWAGEYRALRAAILASDPGPAGHYSFHPNRTLALQAAHIRSLQARAGRLCAELEPENEPPESPSPAILFLRGLRPNAVGEILVEIARPSGNRFALRRCAADTLLAATQVTIGLAAAQRESTELPERLSDLVPTFLPELPSGAFDGGELDLDRSGRRLLARGSELPEATLLQQSPEFALPF